MRLFSDLKSSKRPVLSVRFALAMVRAYQLIVRPFLSGSCRYLPTCSEYAAEAILSYGACKGGWIGLKRVMRCHPFGGSGFDPVPINSCRIADVTDVAGLKVGTTFVAMHRAPVVPTSRSASEI